MALEVALQEPALVFDALVRGGMSRTAAAFQVADVYKRLTGEFPTFESDEE